MIVHYACEASISKVKVKYLVIISGGFRRGVERASAPSPPVDTDPKLGIF